ncbi:MAG: 23S rRNA (adenine(2030)-N(6))-methyltransferase RlmJ [Xanthobacteraceae bacterium]
MNYRHAFHAGNFADVLKHAVLVRVLCHLRGKPGAFRIVDTHAGAGRYDLGGDEAMRSGEWRAGIGRILSAQLSAEARELIGPYLDVVRACNAAEGLHTYLGSPALIRALLRPQDRLLACEVEPGTAAALTRFLAGDRRSKALRVDGWTALKAYVPPKERRGLVLIDPSYEDPGDFARLGAGLAAAWRRWPSGIYLAWYPLKERALPDALARHLQRAGLTKILRIELSIARDSSASASHAAVPLNACGMIAINPPFTLAGELAVLLPALARTLSHDGGGAHRLDWIAPEAHAAR